MPDGGRKEASFKHSLTCPAETSCSWASSVVTSPYWAAAAALPAFTRLIQKDADLTDQILANGSVLYVVARANLTVLTEGAADNPQDEQSRRGDRGDPY